PALQCVGTSATLASEGTLKVQQQQVAEVASLLFGAHLDPDDVVVETLDRSTPIRGSAESPFLAALKARVQSPKTSTTAYGAFVADPLSVWVEEELGLRDTGEGRLVRHAPRQLTGKAGAAMALAQATGLTQDICLAA